MPACDLFPAKQEQGRDARDLQPLCKGCGRVDVELVQRKRPRERFPGDVQHPLRQLAGAAHGSVDEQGEGLVLLAKAVERGGVDFLHLAPSLPFS